MDLLELVIAIYIIISIFIAVGIPGKWMNVGEIHIMNAIIRFVKSLFLNKNIFGLFMGVIVFIVSVPAIIFLLMVDAILVILNLFIAIWNLGIKK